MLCLRKLWVARYYDKGSKSSFGSQLFVADSYDMAGDRAEEWAEQKWPNRKISKVIIEKSKKGEVVDANC